MQAMHPRLVLVSGAPASGKSTLAERLAVELRLPLLARDAIKELLGDSLGAEDRAASQRLGAVSFALLFATAGWLVDAGCGAVVETNFRHGLSEPPLRPLVERSDAVVIHCCAPVDELVRRYAERAARGSRHPVHFDADVLTGFREGLNGGIFDPLALDIPTLLVDTSDGYRPAWEEIVAFARSAPQAPDAR